MSIKEIIESENLEKYAEFKLVLERRVDCDITAKFTYHGYSSEDKNISMLFLMVENGNIVKDYQNSDTLVCVKKDHLQQVINFIKTLSGNNVSHS